MGPTAFFTKSPLVAKIGIVDFNTASKFFSAAMFKHDLHQFVFQAPSGIVGGSELARQL